ncbi:MAG: hypothetical protein QM800_01775 [Paludibacter sp.]
MHKLIFNNTKSIRFRRWSRAGYAIFCSLACCVTIGCVAGSISDQSLQKAVGATVVSLVRDNSGAELPAELLAEQEAELAALEQLQQIVLLEKTFESAAACGLQNILLNLTVGMSESRFNRFLFYSL